jgi:methionine-S-sulfoxide reductase
MTDHNKVAVLAGGCFWGMEDLFRGQPGVVSTRVGYTGGCNTHPTYRNHPGHAEALEITYDPDQTDYRALLEFFFQIHDPTSGTGRATTSAPATVRRSSTSATSRSTSPRTPSPTWTPPASRTRLHLPLSPPNWKRPHRTS